MAAKEKIEGQPPVQVGSEKRASTILPYVLRIGGGLGFLIHLLAIVAIFVIRPRLVQSIHTFTSQIELHTMDLSRVVTQVEQSLLLASETLDDTSDFLVESEDLLSNSSDLLRSVGELVGEDATRTIQSTQDALEASIPGSQAVDSMLKALSVLEPLTGFSYNPEKTLSQGLDNVTASLEPLPASLREVQSQLEEAAGELDDLTPGVGDVADDLSRFSATIEGVSEQLDASETVFQATLNAVKLIQNRVASISWISTIILSVFFVFGAISQLSAVLVGKQI